MHDIKNLTYKYIDVNGIQLHVAFAGSPKGVPVILLHGFPDASFGWKHQINALSKKNFYVIAPDQRGYNLSDKPKDKKKYMMDLLVHDIITLANELNLDKFNLAGHDFGAIVSWNLVENYSHRVKKLVIFNGPQPTTMEKFLKENKKQRRKSWYAFFFKMKWFPEILLRSRNWRNLASNMKNSFSEKDLQEYKAAWSQPGAIKAMVNWYRCLFLQKSEDKPKRRIKIPTLIVWGKQDPHIMWELASESAAMCDNCEVKFIEDATHWVLQDDPENTSKFMIEHFS